MRQLIQDLISWDEEKDQRYQIRVKERDEKLRELQELREHQKLQVKLKKEEETSQPISPADGEEVPAAEEGGQPP